MSIDVMFKQAHAAFRAGDFADAERRYQALVRLKPTWAGHNLGVLYVATQRFDAAEAAFRQVLALEPGLAATRHSLGMLLMGAGRYSEGWALMEARRELSNPAIPAPSVPFPEWRGEDLTGRSLVVFLEQGFGDQIQYFRFLLELARRGTRVTFICRPELVTLFEGRGVAVVGAAPGFRYPDADFWTLICSAPLHMGVTLETLPSAPYLTLRGPKSGGVGVMAKGRDTHVNDRNRSLPPEAAAQLASLGRDLAPEATGARDFRDTAAIVAGLDLVVTVDTSVAHLAGAMGKPVWILLPAVETDWRWLRDRRDSPWYPSARLYRQTAPGQWGPVLKQIAGDLAG